MNFVSRIRKWWKILSSENKEDFSVNFLCIIDKLSSGGIFFLKDYSICYDVARKTISPTISGRENMAWR